jgi:hypothetical protein
MRFVEYCVRYLPEEQAMADIYTVMKNEVRIGFVARFGNDLSKTPQVKFVHVSAWKAALIGVFDDHLFHTTHRNSYEHYKEHHLDADAARLYKELYLEIINDIVNRIKHDPNNPVHHIA